MFSPGVADVLIAGLGLACFGLGLWLVSVRDWRVYGVFCLWPQVVGEMRVAHLTPALVLLAAIAWRTRGARGAPGAAIGLATSVKFLMWPLLVWLAATRRVRDVIVAAAVVLASLLLVLPFTDLDAYVRTLARLSRAFNQDSYTVFGLLVQAGAPESAARATTFVIGGAILVATWRYRSFTLAIAAALALSPIAWLDYFALAAVPLAVYRPRLSWVWFLPLATWGLQGAGFGIGDVWHTVRLLVVFAVVLGVTSSTNGLQRASLPTTPGERSGVPGRRGCPADHRPHELCSASRKKEPGTAGRPESLAALAALAGLVALPVLLYVVMLQLFWQRGELGIDFTQTLLPAAREIADGNSPYPAYGYPPLVAFALVPSRCCRRPSSLHSRDARRDPGESVDPPVSGTGAATGRHSSGALRSTPYRRGT